MGNIQPKTNSRRRSLEKTLPSYPFIFSCLLKTIGGVISLILITSYQPLLPLNTGEHIVVVQAQTAEHNINKESLPLVFQLPHPGYLTTRFSRWHPGIDLATGIGMPIRPIARGIVVDTTYSFWGFGLNVTIDHGYGYKSRYAHMGKIYVSKGQEVTEEDIIGVVGMTGNTTGPHTHLEVIKDGRNIDPMTILPPITPLVRAKASDPEFQAIQRQKIASGGAFRLLGRQKVEPPPSPPPKPPLLPPPPTIEFKIFTQQFYLAPFEAPPTDKSLDLYSSKYSPSTGSKIWALLP